MEFAIELQEQNQPFPESRQALYHAILAPIFRSWTEAEQGDYRELLCARAYEMLRSRDAFFDPQDNLAPSEPRLPQELRARLIEKKFLVRSGNDYHFRHDLIRAYLAALYFAPRWQSLLQQEDVAVDSNWRPLLEFVVLDFENSAYVKELMFEVLEKNARLTGEVFTWLKDSHPDLCADWSDRFELAYGRAMLHKL